MKPNETYCVTKPDLRRMIVAVDPSGTKGPTLLSSTACWCSESANNSHVYQSGAPVREFPRGELQSSWP